MRIDESGRGFNSSIVIGHSPILYLFRVLDFLSMSYLLPFDVATIPTETFDFVIVGSGVAGLSCAVELEAHGSVAVLTKEGLSDGSTQWAQGGIAAVLSPEPLDSSELHQEDTVKAGAGLCDASAVDVLVREGPHRIRQLIARGAHFDTEPSGELKLTREAAHRARRIVHADGDSTGREVQRSLTSNALQSGDIRVLENTISVDFFVNQDAEGNRRCCGVLALDANGNLKLFRAKATIAATGGLGAIYKVTTNPPVLTGDGVAMAFRAGASLMDMEFVQFHPTAFAKGPNNPKFLISEAVRGEGAVLLNNKGERFMQRYHPDAELAPRDVVSRAIAQEILSTGTRYVTLDLTQNTAAEIAARFPKIYSTCVSYGIDPATQPIPVSPAEHYMMGGIRTDLNGATDISGLLACGECACTGVHGANRLASNSMLEGLVFGIRTVRAAIALKTAMCPPEETPHLSEAAAPIEYSMQDVEAARTRVQELMWQYAGLVRNGEGLQSALNELNALSDKFLRPAPTREAIELANMIQTAQLVTRASLERRESRGAHFRTDFPNLDDEHWQHHILLRDENGTLKIESAPTQ
ncbi:MAG TPA: L-aspartate oxidase [Abditibacteriaceae bacterium]|nr:L-aspartate oxidase [Abditibacteriaceae bacterium]